MVATGKNTSNLIMGCGQEGAHRCMDPGHADEGPPVGPQALHATALMMCLPKRTKTVRRGRGEGTEGLPHVGSVLQPSSWRKEGNAVRLAERPGEGRQCGES